MLALRFFAFYSVFTIWMAACAYGQNADAAIDFDRAVRPILKARCLECHRGPDAKGGLRLDAPSLARRGGDSGEVIVAGNATASLLVHRIESSSQEDRMPPTGDALSPSEINAIKLWIDQGAVWIESDEDRLAVQDPRRNHWAWQPVSKVDVPKVNLPVNAEHDALNEVDQFVLEKLQAQGLQLSPPADRRTLIRRLAFDLWGLPPSTEEVNRFMNDTDPLAYERLVDAMLASPRYGERWARHWLDIAHYADTHGFERDQRRDNAWPYRDWVIRALNSDMPYDDFLRQQIAGDVDRPDDPNSVIATGFLAAGPWDFVGQAETPSPVLKRLARADDLDDMVTQVMTSTCAITIHCARCHDHKLDPIAQREYYSLWAVFTGVKRSDRFVSDSAKQQADAKRASLSSQIDQLRTELAKARGTGWSLADMVGGGNGLGTGKRDVGIDPASGKPQSDRRGFLDNVQVNKYFRSEISYVDGVFVPSGGDNQSIVVSRTDVQTSGLPQTSGKVWDAIRNGPVHSQFSTKLGNIDFAAADHALLSIHANAGITFDLMRMRQAGMPPSVILSAGVGYFGETPRSGASVHVLLDGKVVWERLQIGRDDGIIPLEVNIPNEASFLTLVATDGGNDIGHDQICFTDPLLLDQAASTEVEQSLIESLTARLAALQAELQQVTDPPKVYAVVGEKAPEVHLLARGDTEQPREAVAPGAVACLAHADSSFEESMEQEGARRKMLAEWIVHPNNPLTQRVIVNRLWHHHFGVGIVDTPSDFGAGGGVPSHPELLDWLANRLLDERWSLKAMHRLICLSATYRQQSYASAESQTKPLQSSPQHNALRGSEADDAAIRAKRLDTNNRLLWRQNPRRLEAESFRDAVLQTSGTLQLEMFGPGYRDFDYKEEYAPVYTYIAPNRPELWRRTIYRFAVRTTPHGFLSALDCPNLANMTPVRNITTTALQSLAVLNDDFMIQQSEHFASRIEQEMPDASIEAKLTYAFRCAFNREPTQDELTASLGLASTQSLAAVCRMLLAANEFIFVD